MKNNSRISVCFVVGLIAFLLSACTQSGSKNAEKAESAMLMDKSAVPAPHELIRLQERQVFEVDGDKKPYAMMEDSGEKVRVGDKPIPIREDEGTGKKTMKEGEVIRASDGKLVKGEDKRNDKPDSAEKEKERQRSYFPDSALGRQLEEHLAAMMHIGIGAEEDYQGSLERLRKSDPEASDVLYTIYKTVPEMEYFLRWQIVETLKELGSEAAYGPLSSIVTSGIPPERFESKEHFSQDYEIMIRSNALEGLAVHSGNKVKGADDILLKMAMHKNITLRRSAIRSYLKGAGDKKEMSERSDALKRMLDKKDHGLVTLRVTEVREVPHPEEVTTQFERSKIKRDDQMQKGEDSAPKVER